MKISNKKVFSIILIFLFIATIVMPGINPTIVNATGVDITTHGATSNDETDDTVAIQAAINAAGLNDTVFIPDGTYNISRSLTAKSDIKIEGQSQNGAILKFVGSAATDQVLNLTGCSNIRLTNFTLDGNSNEYLHQGINADNSSLAGNYGNILIQHLTIKDMSWHAPSAFGPHGILLCKVQDTEVSDCTIYNIGVYSGGGSGIRIGYDSTRVKILRNTIANTGEGGIRCNVRCTDFIIRNNRVTGSGLVKEGLSIECYSDCSRFIVEDNDVDSFLSIAASSFMAVRRNLISDKTGRHMTNGLEAVSQESIYTDNIIDDGHVVGVSISGAERYQYLGYNTFKAENMWGSQLQGDSDFIKYQYFYKCDFNNQTKGEANPPYPGYEGYGFRLNGNVDYIELENCYFNSNARYGIQGGGTAKSENHISMRNCVISGNAEGAFSPGLAFPVFEMLNCTVTGNVDDSTPVTSSFNNERPVAVINSGDTGAIGETISFNSASTDTDGSISHVLWDFGDGVPTNISSTTHTYNAPGNYRVTLIAWDNDGRAERAEKTIVIGGGSTPTPEATTKPTPIPTPTPTPEPTAVPTPQGIKLSGSCFGTSPSYAVGGEFDKAFDGNTDTFFDYKYGSGGYTGLDLGAGNEKAVTLIRYYPRSPLQARMNGGKFQGSNTAQDSGYVDIYTITTTPIVDWNEVKISGTTPYRYIRYLSPDDGYGNVCEIEFYTSNTVVTPTPTPFATKVSGTLFGTTPAWGSDREFPAAFDGNINTFFDCTATTGGNVGMDLGEGNGKNITKIRFYPRNPVEGRMDGGRFQGSNTSMDSGYFDLYTIIGTPPSGWNEVTVTDVSKYRYIRYLSPDNSYGNVCEIEFYTGPVQPPVIAKITGTLFGTTPSWGPNGVFSKAFDGNVNTFFDYYFPNNGYTGMDLAPGNEKKVTKIRFFPRSPLEGRMTGGKFQGSNTSSDSGYSDLYTITETPPAGWNEVTVNNENGYRYLRYLSPDDGYGNVCEIEFYGILAPVPEPTPTPNVAPVFGTIVNQNIDEGKELNFGVTALDPNGDTVTIKASSIPVGATFNEVSGVFNWKPDFSKAGKYTVNFEASDGSLVTNTNVEITVREVPAKELTEGLEDYIKGLSINSLSKDLLILHLEELKAALNKDQYKLAVVKLKVFMNEIRVLEPAAITKEQLENILKDSIDICLAIKADVQGREKIWVDKKVEALFDSLEKHKTEGITENTYSEIMKDIVELINTI